MLLVVPSGGNRSRLMIQEYLLPQLLSNKTRQMAHTMVNGQSRQANLKPHHPYLIHTLC